jgi:CHAD domain-containing protein
MANQSDDTKQIKSPAERLLAAIDKLKKPTAKSAHLYRTSLRRFQAWTAVFHPAADTEHRQALKYLDKLRKATGKLRDCEVHLDILKQLEDDGGKDTRKLQQELRSRRKSYKKKLTKLLSDSLLKDTSRSLLRIDTAPKTVGSMDQNNGQVMLRLALDEYRAFVQNRPPLSPENLHEYRLACKHFRYTAEMAGNDAQAKHLLDTWKQVQDVSGDWHDYLTLAELAEEICGDGRLHALLVERRDSKYSDATKAIEQAEELLQGASSAPPRKKPGTARSGGKIKIA